MKSILLDVLLIQAIIINQEILCSVVNKSQSKLPLRNCVVLFNLGDLQRES